MVRARTLAIAVLLLSYGAVGARQPAVRTAVPLPATTDEIAKALGVSAIDRSTLMITIVRAVFDAPDGQSASDAAVRGKLAAVLRAAPRVNAETVPLPLDPSIWRETLLQRNISDADIVRAILSDRQTALLYHGLAALDDETLGWLGPERATLLDLRRNAGTFAVFGRSIRIKGTKVAVPGGPDAEPIWSAVVGAPATRPAAFVQRLFSGSGRLAWFYDTIAHLDPPTQRFALGGAGETAARLERVRDLLDVFEAVSRDWRVDAWPFSRPTVDPALMLTVLRVTEDGRLIGPTSRVMWERVFRGEGSDSGSIEIFPADLAADRTAPVDAPWLARRVSMSPSAASRRRMETVLFAQRVFPKHRGDSAEIATALRGAYLFPALLLTLERIGITSPAALAGAARHAAALTMIRPLEQRTRAAMQFQSVVALLERTHRAGTIDTQGAQRLLSSLLVLQITSQDGYEARFSAWLRSNLLKVLCGSDGDGGTLEDSLLRALAGPSVRGATIEWEGVRYRVDAAAAELRRLRRVRERQLTTAKGSTATTSLDDALAAAISAAPSERERAESALAATLAAIVYAAHLGDPEGPSVAGTDVSARHDLEMVEGVGAQRAGAAWEIPREEHGPNGWRVVGSILGLDVALARLALRRLDPTRMPPAPTLTRNERHTAMVTAAFLNPSVITDDGRDEIAAALRRGRARVASLNGDRAELERIASEAGVSEWRREALGWALEHDREAASSAFSLVELLWLGRPRAPARALDAWGAATTPLDGCLCLRMPAPLQWEAVAGRPAHGLLSTRGADVALRVAELLAELQLPASLAPAVIAFAMQDVIDSAVLAHFDDWPAFERAARELGRERAVDYVAALAADGPLIAAPTTAIRD